MGPNNLVSAVALLAGLGLSAAAESVTLTGEAITSVPGVSFPTIQPVLQGTSLILGPGGGYTLMELPVYPSGALPATGPAQVSVSVNLTRLTCVQPYGCIGPNTEEDFDPILTLEDGKTGLGAQMGDNENGAAWAIQNGVGTPPGLGRYSLFAGAGFPNIGEAFDVLLRLTLLDASTLVTIAFENGEATYAGWRMIDRAAPLRLVLTHDNDFGERYQINSVTISPPSIIPLPAPLWLLGAGFLSYLGLSFSRRRT